MSSSVNITAYRLTVNPRIQAGSQIQRLGRPIEQAIRLEPNLIVLIIYVGCGGLYSLFYGIGLFSNLGIQNFKCRPNRHFPTISHGKLLALITWLCGITQTQGLQAQLIMPVQVRCSELGILTEQMKRMLARKTADNTMPVFDQNTIAIINRKFQIYTASTEAQGLPEVPVAYNVQTYA